MWVHAAVAVVAVRSGMSARKHPGTARVESAAFTGACVVLWMSGFVILSRIVFPVYLRWLALSDMQLSTYLVERCPGLSHQPHA